MVEIFNQTDQEIEELETVEKVLESAIVKENLGDVSFNLIIVDNDYIHELNRDYRKIDRETDVITFALEDEDSLTEYCEKNIILSDLYDCPITLQEFLDEDNCDGFAERTVTKYQIEDKEFYLLLDVYCGW